MQCPLAVHISHLMEVCTEAENHWGTSSMDVALVCYTSVTACGIYFNQS